MEGRIRVLSLLKGVVGVYPNVRMMVTSRSASYTGRLGFEPDLTVVELAAFDWDQVNQFCQKWTVHRKRPEDYLNGLMAAISTLGQQVESSSGDQALTENPLMLTAICMVFERHRRLPDDRGSLCDLLIDDLCRSRNSRDDQRGWKLDDTQKKDLLQRIAFGMQEEGAQSWPVSRAIETAMKLVPAGELQT
jgi:predicted NACHT family NTPase